ncbi:MAG: prepilin-type N-terminal cleavage/methylation domain-containing protein [Gemmatimonadota bacterium]
MPGYSRSECGERPPGNPGQPSARAGFTIVELLAVIAIIGLLAGIAIPRVKSTVNAANIAKAIGDIEAIQIDLESIEAGGTPLPANLSAIGRGTLLDPWGNPYQYYPFAGNPPGGRRKDRFLVPINSTFDLYSSGPDGRSSPPLTAGASQDDIVRANDGGFIGVASNY